MTRAISPRPHADFDIHPSADEIRFFNENGYLVVERITTDAEIAWMREIFEHIFSPDEAAKDGAPIDRSGTGGAARLTQAFFPEIKFPELLETAFRRNAKRYTAALLGVDESRISSWGHMILKQPGGRAAEWHQDHAYWQPEFDYCALGCWLPMHDISKEMGAMQFIPGSHRRGLLHHRHQDLPEHNVLRVADAFDEAEAVVCPLKMGGATFHHSETLHYTAPNTTDRPRLAFPTEFQVMPVRRAEPAVMPWVDERRAVVGTQPAVHVIDGKLVPA
ncbi:MAG: phytanoyl-CoA dioxygenase family protein [Alphaproteobacteria bacterium]|nr:phytanoyl-CoA dioxygenase family protein [Alphaproteobacteria bacterium]